jgi:hypothetical protein
MIDEAMLARARGEGQEPPGSKRTLAHRELVQMEVANHVVTQHLMVSTTATTLAGRVLLGVESDTTTL